LAQYSSIDADKNVKSKKTPIYPKQNTRHSEEKKQENPDMETKTFARKQNVQSQSREVSFFSLER